jgi:DNA-binding XRE family transcriptional regulator
MEESNTESFVTLRKKAGLTQEGLADLLKVTDHTIRNWEKGRTVPEWTPGQTLSVCQLLGCTLEELADAFPDLKTESALTA